MRLPILITKQSLLCVIITSYSHAINLQLCSYNSLQDSTGVAELGRQGRQLPTQLCTA